MAHGHPDYGPGAPVSTIYGVLDMAELAARLGSIVTFDRRGNVIGLDDFESGLAQWYKGGSGTGHSVDWCSEYSRSGAFCAKLTGGSSLGLYSTMIKKLPYPVIGKLGVEVSFDITNDVNYFEVRFYLYDGTTLHEPTVRFTRSTGALAYYDENADYQDIVTGLTFRFSGELFKTVKLVVDFDNELYSRVIYNGTTYDLSSYQYFSEASAISPHLRIALFVTSEAASNGIAYVDDLIVTQNEP